MIEVILTAIGLALFFTVVLTGTGPKVHLKLFWVLTWVFVIYICGCIILSTLT